MKYGLIVFSDMPKGRTDISSCECLFNVGDNIQMYALRRLMVNEMGIDNNDIVEIDFHNIATYKGEYLIVPINLFFFGCHDAKETWFPASPYIIPVFIGVHFSSSFLTQEEVAYLSYYSPIGCRDEFTLSTMRKYNIPSYLFGCSTATLPRREKKSEKKTTFLVDVDYDKICKYIPDSYIENVKIISHVRKGFFSVDNFKEMEELAVEYLNDYRENASLVITSRLHCASPCIAMGIPTIMIVKEKSVRYSWLNKLIPIYSENEISNIDWDINPIDFETTKNNMIKLFINRMNTAFSKYQLMYDISSFFENQNEISFIRPFEQVFDSLKILLKQKIGVIYIWGATALAEEIYNLIMLEKTENDIRLIDEYNSVIFHGSGSVRFDDINQIISVNDLVIITPTSSQNEILDRIKKNGVKCKVLLCNGKIFQLDN